MGRNKADFNGISYIYTGSHPTSHQLEAFDPMVGDVVGYMRWNKEHGRVEDLSVDPEHRRKGIATGMWNYAKSLGVTTPRHSEVRTESGLAWSRSVES